jgi:hypothetical protein
MVTGTQPAAAARTNVSVGRDILIALAIKMSLLAVLYHCFFWGKSSAQSRSQGHRSSSAQSFLGESMNSTHLLDLSRLQFATTAMYHFLFVPLTLGLSVLIAIMESVYVMTGRVVWREMTRFWSILFGINFAMGVATGITMEFSSAPIGRITRTTSATSSVYPSLSKD